MIPGCGAGKGDSPRNVDQKTYGENFNAINWRKGEPKRRPWLLNGRVFKGDPYAGMDIHQRVLKSYYDRECSGELSREKVKGEYRKFREAHVAAQDPRYFRKSNDVLARMKDGE